MLNAISRRGGQSKLWSNADFEIGANLGMGTFGVVKRARENTTGHIVALKKVSTCNVAPRNRKQILREIEIQSRLKHRHILQLYNYYMNEEFTEIILIVEYAAGGDLFSLIEEASKANTVVRPQLAAKYIYQIANALEFCHLNRNIIHRDLKPENVLLDINGDAKLADFGASVHSPNENPRCSMVGTLNFMAPELLSNDWYLFDVDHWALGVVAFMLTAGQMPFHGANFEELKESIFRNEVLYPIHMPAGAADLVSQLLRYSGTGIIMNLFGLLPWLVSWTHGQNNGCGRTWNVQPDTVDRFTYQYTGPWQFNFCFTTAANFRVTLNCGGVKMAKTGTRCRDTLNVTTDGRPGEIYCDPFQVKGRNIIMRLNSNDGRGNFQCRFKSERADSCKCGYTGDYKMKIVGGSPAGMHEFTSMAALTDVDGMNLQCGATIISERLALTAAHCVVDADMRINDPSVYGLTVGAYRIEEKSETKEVYRIKRFLPNSDYRSGRNYADIALVETRIVMFFYRNVGPACLPFKFVNNYLYNQNVIIAGWGSVGFGEENSNTLLKGTVTIRYPQLCQDSEAYRGNFDGNTMICTLRRGTDSCQFDSGGPVYYRDPSSGLLFQLGITSAGYGCDQGVPSISTRVSSFLNSIRQAYPAEEFCTIS